MHFFTDLFKAVEFFLDALDLDSGFLELLVRFRAAIAKIFHAVFEGTAFLADLLKRTNRQNTKKQLDKLNMSHPR